MKRAIVTGANGFVGTALVNELLSNGYIVYAIGHKQRSKRLPEHRNLFYFSVELSEISTLRTYIPEPGCDAFFHLAWQGSAGQERSDFALQLQNAQWTLDSLMAAKELGCRRFVGAGSIMEREALAAVGLPGNRPGMGYIYGIGKLAAHMLGMTVAANLAIDFLWPVITNIYGVGELSPRIVNSTIRKCISKTPLEFTAATQNYDFVYVDDAALAFRLIAENGIPFTEYLIGSGHARPLKEFLLEMKNAIAPDMEFHFGAVPFTGVNLPLEAFDCANTLRDTGFKARTGFADGCKKTFDWLRQKEAKDDSKF